jgi:LPS-assembly protein
MSCIFVSDQPGDRHRPCSLGSAQRHHAGGYASFNIDEDTATSDDPTFRFRQFHARGKANKLLIEDRDRYRAIRATYTNCDVGDDDWYMKVQRLDIDRLRDVGEARNATLYFKEVPILYTPYMDFPVSSRRKSGFLPPRSALRRPVA